MKMIENSIKEIGYDLKKMPLGKLDDRTVKSAYTVLTDVTTRKRKTIYLGEIALCSNNNLFIISFFFKQQLMAAIKAKQ
jgi:hypothetical protein